MMKPPQAWPTVESKVYRPSDWLAYLVGLVFLIAGVVAFCLAGPVANKEFEVWILRIGGAIFAIPGSFLFVVTVKNAVWPTLVRHAAPEVLPEVPNEPLVVEGSIVYGGITHELVADDRGWQFRPCLSWQKTKRGILWFVIPFMIAFAAMLSWVFHSQMKIANWPISILLGSMITLVCGGTTFGLIGMLVKASYLRLCKLTIPKGSGDLELDMPESINIQKIDLISELQRTFSGSTLSRHLEIPRETVTAVQLCPWKFVVSGPGQRSMTWAVQGLLVLSSADEPTFCRVPLLLTGEYAKAARTMQRLAEVLGVPYLFGADANGWKAENARAKSRPPLRTGGMQS